MKKKKILIVDDDDDLREMIAYRLAAEGYGVFQAKNGEEGLDSAKEMLPDLIITDVMMPKLDGNQMLKKIRDESFGKKIPCIVMTARIKMKDYFEIVGIDQFLEKPFSMDDLVSIVNHALNPTRESRQTHAVPKRVLVAGRENAGVETLVEQVRAMGCHMDFVLSGEQVISKAVLFLPNILIIEDQIHGMILSELVKIIRHLPQFRKIPILIYSAAFPFPLKEEDRLQVESNEQIFIGDAMEKGATEYLGRLGAGGFLERLNKYFKKGTIIVVDDDQGLVHLARNKLEAEGYKVFAARDGKDGLDLIKRINPSLIILDIVMPEMNGYDLLSRLKADLSVSHIPVMMLTVKGAEDEIQKALDLGADDYLIKPVPFNLLIKKIKLLVKEL